MSRSLHGGPATDGGLQRRGKDTSAGVATPVLDGFDSSLVNYLSKNYFATETTHISISTSDDLSSEVTGINLLLSLLRGRVRKLPP